MFTATAVPCRSLRIRIRVTALSEKAFEPNDAGSFETDEFVIAAFRRALVKQDVPPHQIVRRISSPMGARWVCEINVDADHLRSVGFWPDDLCDEFDPLFEDIKVDIEIF